MNPRLASLYIVKSVIVDGKSLAAVISFANKSSEVGLSKQLCFGLCRYYFQLKFILSELMQKPIKEKEIDVELLLLLGMYELSYLDTAEHAVVSEIVNCVKALKKTWAIKLTNGILRNFLRQKASLLKKSTSNLQACYSHPKWLIEKIQRDWPHHWQDILTANNQQAPMSLRVNLQKISRKDYLILLFEHNMDAQPAKLVNTGILLSKACSVSKLPGFSQGFCSVQDIAAQLAAEFLQLKPDLRILDACAAPGGKTAHILEKEPNLAHLLALDSDSKRGKKIHENLNRLGLQCEVKTACAEDLDAWWEGKAFHRILLDAPCSASGVIRRHPDIKLLRRVEDLPALVTQQRKLLQALWQTLESGGVLLYATCSIFPEENAENIHWFLQQARDAELIPLPLSSSHTKTGLQLFPGEYEGDGFYYALLRKG